MTNARALLILAATLPAAFAQIFDWDCTNAVGPCNNACFATNNGLANGVLTYDGDADNAEDRREDVGCGTWRPCGSTGYGAWGDSCDEYPFASTFEGGAGGTLRCVPRNENSSKASFLSSPSRSRRPNAHVFFLGQGGSLSNFYRGLAQGTQFQVVIRNYGNANFCVNPSAPNDGSQFHLVSGAYTNLKRRRGLSFEDTISRRSSIKLREFEDANGDRVMSLNSNLAGTLVGRSVYNNGNWTPIVREILIAVNIWTCGAASQTDERLDALAAPTKLAARLFSRRKPNNRLKQDARRDDRGSAEDARPRGSQGTPAGRTGGEEEGGGGGGGGGAREKVKITCLHSYLPGPSCVFALMPDTLPTYGSVGMQCNCVDVHIWHPDRSL
ncbi:hypothetical protein S40288_11547 [Stachybotrys chartarum IBT 40288]|nr:hypothetical protein S40288_11547 [Stachybotrys chartarum IBT 40288]